MRSNEPEEPGLFDLAGDRLEDLFRRDKLAFRCPSWPGCSILMACFELLIGMFRMGRPSVWVPLASFDLYTEPEATSSVLWTLLRCRCLRLKWTESSSELLFALVEAWRVLVTLSPFFFS